MNPNSTTLPRTRSRWRRVLAVAAVLAAVGIAVGIWWARRMEEMVLDAYRADLAEAELIAFLAEHDNRLPVDEVERSGYLQSRSQDDPPYFQLGEIRQQFRIDFQFPLEEVDWTLDWEQQRGGFSVLQANPGRDTRWTGPDLNERLYEYLQSTSAHSQNRQDSVDSAEPNGNPTAGPTHAGQ